MANDFSKEERVAFEQMLEGFNDLLVISREASVYRPPDIQMERARDTVWRPQPYIMQSFDGTDQTGNFGDQTQLSVPVSLNYNKAVPWVLTATELRDALQENRLGESAKQKLASDINIALLNVASVWGSLVVARSTAPGGFDDVAQCEAIMNEQGVPQPNRCLCLGTRDYNGLAADLAGRQTLQTKALTAYERSYIGLISSFDSFKMDYAYALTAAAGTGVTVNGASQYHTPAAISVAATGEVENVDNRSQVLTIAVTSGTVKIGDAFTIAGVNAVHHITKNDTGQLKTFRIVGIVSGAGGSGDVLISPPITSGEGGTDAELMYKNVTATPANGAAITFLNTQDAQINVFWQKDAIEIIAGSYAVPTDAGAAVMKGTTDQGIELTMQKQYDINTMNTKYRVDTLFGTANKNPEMSGILVFNQT